VKLYFVVSNDIFREYKSMQSFKCTSDNKVTKCVLGKLKLAQQEILSIFKQFLYNFESNRNIQISLSNDDEIKKKK
jgi:hypothetical protein